MIFRFPTFSLSLAGISKVKNNIVNVHFQIQLLNKTSKLGVVGRQFGSSGRLFPGLKSLAPTSQKIACHEWQSFLFAPWTSEVENGETNGYFSRGMHLQKLFLMGKMMIEPWNLRICAKQAYMLQCDQWCGKPNEPTMTGDGFHPTLLMDFKCTKCG